MCRLTAESGGAARSAPAEDARKKCWNRRARNKAAYAARTESTGMVRAWGGNTDSSLGQAPPSRPAACPLKTRWRDACKDCKVFNYERRRVRAPECFVHQHQQQCDAVKSRQCTQRGIVVGTTGLRPASTCGLRKKASWSNERTNLSGVEAKSWTW